MSLLPLMERYRKRLQSEPDLAFHPKTAGRIRNAVGEAGRNERNDVAKVESLLALTGDLDLDRTEGPTGYWSARADEAARNFQKRKGLKVDGKLNPHGPTLRQLAENEGGGTDENAE